MDFKEDLRKHFNILLTEEQEEMFSLYFNKLIEYNKHTNLTRITEENDVYYKHFYDSLTIKTFIEGNGVTLCDMGSGAGFPSIPLKIIMPNLKVTIIDSSNKRIKFLKELVTELKLDDVNLVHSRIEDFGINNQQKFDYVTARALGNLTLISEMAIPMLKVDGIFIAMKGSKSNEELNNAISVFRILKSNIVNEMNFELPYDYGERTIYVIKKDVHVKGYPRKYQEMVKKPL